MLWGWLVFINLVTLLTFRYDKRQAQRNGARRTPEATLLLLLAAGGVVGGAVGMYLRPRHKTRKTRFVVVLIAASTLYAYLLYRVLVMGG